MNEKRNIANPALNITIQFNMSAQTSCPSNRFQERRLLPMLAGDSPSEAFTLQPTAVASMPVWAAV